MRCHAKLKCSVIQNFSEVSYEITVKFHAKLQRSFIQNYSAVSVSLDTKLQSSLFYCERAFRTLGLRFYFIKARSQIFDLAPAPTLKSRSYLVPNDLTTKVPVFLYRSIF